MKIITNRWDMVKLKVDANSVDVELRESDKRRSTHATSRPAIEDSQ
jgi:hypothetical protein